MTRFALHVLISVGFCLSTLSVPLRNATISEDEDDPCAEEPVNPPGCPVLPRAVIPSVPDEVPNNYIVTLNLSTKMDQHLQQLQSFISANQKCMTMNNSVLLQVDQPYYKFYSGQFDEITVSFISHSTGVASVSFDTEMKMDDPVDNGTATSSREIHRRRTGSGWNLGRITQDKPVVPGGPDQGASDTSDDWTYFHKSEANGTVQIYIIDSGVNKGHEEFGGRATTAAIAPVEKQRSSPQTGNTPPPPPPGPQTDEDIVGHGTAVASVAAGSKLGVANRADIISIKISNAMKASRSAVYWGMDEAIKHYKTVRGGKGGAIINLSISTTYNDDQEKPFGAAMREGIHVVTAAGNGQMDMCEQWSNGLGAMNVGATDIHDNKASFSNYGKCVDVYAPGESIKVASIGGNSVYEVVSGTSFAAPLISGMIASIISATPNRDVTTDEMRDLILTQAAKNHVLNIGKFAGSKDLLATFEKSLRTGPLVDLK
ncbi:peptidase S8/S53 domain-containing protein [Mycena crocata]|nr:peptidase S8/S53 domain-containing protein [Mycena crocata]